MADNSAGFGPTSHPPYCKLTWMPSSFVFNCFVFKFVPSWVLKFLWLLPSDWVCNFCDIQNLCFQHNFWFLLFQVPEVMKCSDDKELLLDSLPNLVVFKLTFVCRVYDGDDADYDGIIRCITLQLPSLKTLYLCDAHTMKKCTLTCPKLVDINLRHCWRLVDLNFDAGAPLARLQCESMSIRFSIYTTHRKLQRVNAVTCASWHATSPSLNPGEERSFLLHCRQNAIPHPCNYAISYCCPLLSSSYTYNTQTVVLPDRSYQEHPIMFAPLTPNVNRLKLKQTKLDGTWHY